MSVNENKEVPTKNTILATVGGFPIVKAQYIGEFPEGEIVLKYGNHLRPNSGFGYIHIIAEHTADLDLHGLEHTIEGVINYIQLIFCTGARIYSEFVRNKQGNYRPTVVWSRVGTLILEKEFLPAGEIRYSVVTAYGKKNPVGTQIGSIPRKKRPIKDVF